MTAGPDSPLRRPNVLILFTDQQRWDALGAAGNPHIQTPNLDALARRGVLFHRAYCNAPVCMPSRHSMLSGLYPTTVGTTTNGTEMDPDVPCLQHYLAVYGYYTANLGKLHFLNHATRDHRALHPRFGFDEAVISDEPGCYADPYLKWVEMHDPDAVEACMCSTPPECRTPRVHKQPRDTDAPYVFEGPEHLTHTAFVADITCDFITRRAGSGRPWMAIAGFYATHTPLNPPQRFLDLYDPATLPSPKMNPGDNTRGHSDAHWRTVKQHYYALVSHVDDQCGRILHALDATGQTDQTVIVFVSDHGEYLGDHGRIQKGMPGHDAAARVPLIVAGPGIPAAEAPRSELIELVDLVPTLLDCCGVQADPGLQGRSFRPLLTGRPYTPRTSAFLEERAPRGAGWKAIRTPDHKYCLANDGRELLYDLRHDPDELNDLAADPAHSQTLDACRMELLRRWFDTERPARPQTGPY